MPSHYNLINWEPPRPPGIMQGGKSVLELLRGGMEKAGVKTLDQILREQLEYEIPEEEIGRRLNIYGRQMTGAEQRQTRRFQEGFAGRTGGRMSGARGGEEIGGQYALARAIGTAQIMQQAFNQELQMRQAALEAYIRKYGYDKNAKLAEEQLDLQREQMYAGMVSDIGASGSLLSFLKM